MTMPRERTLALQNTREFLRRLLRPSATPRVPRAIRLEAYWLLRHFPWDCDLAKAAEKAPDTWGAPEMAEPPVTQGE